MRRLTVKVKNKHVRNNIFTGIRGITYPGCLSLRQEKISENHAYKVQSILLCAMNIGRRKFGVKEEDISTYCVCSRSIRWEGDVRVPFHLDNLKSHLL
jgi:hypothetical protein